MTAFRQSTRYPGRRPSVAAHRTMPILDAGLYPDWFRAMPVEGLPTTPLAAIALRHVPTVGDLEETPRSLLLDMPGLGPASTRKVVEAVAAAYAKACKARSGAPGPASKPFVGGRAPWVNAAVTQAAPKRVEETSPLLGRPADPYSPFDLCGPLADHVRDHLHLLNPRQESAIRHKLGLDVPVLTEAAHAAKLGVTPARVGQIRAKALARIDAATGCLAAIYARLRELGAPGPVPEDVVVAEPWASGLAGAVLRSVVTEAAGLHLVEAPRLGTVYVGFTSRAWAGYTKAIREALLAAGPDGTPSLVLGELGRRIGAGDPGREAALKVADATLARLGTLGTMRVYGLGRDVAHAMLDAAPAGLSLDDLCARFERDDPEPPGRENLREWLQDAAVHVGDGLYVRRRRVKGGDALAARCRKVMAGAPGRTWATAELAQAIATGPGDVPDPVTLDLALAEDEVLVRVGPMRWRDGRKPVPTGFEDVAVRALEAWGGPMPAAALLKAAEDVMGPGSRQLKQGGRLVALGRGVWGLAGRDLPVDGTDSLVDAAMALFGAGVRDPVEMLARLGVAAAEAGIRDAGALSSLLRARKGLVRDRRGLRARMVKEVDGGPSMPGVLSGLLADAGAKGLSRVEAMSALTEATGRKAAGSYVGTMLKQSAHRGGDGRWYVRKDLAEAAPVPDDGKGVRRHDYPKVRKTSSPGRKATAWSPEDVGTLKGMLAAGASALEISRAMEGRVSRCAVLAKMHRIRNGKAGGG